MWEFYESILPRLFYDSAPGLSESESNRISIKHLLRNLYKQADNIAYFYSLHYSPWSFHRPLISRTSNRQYSISIQSSRVNHIFWISFLSYISSTSQNRLSGSRFRASLCPLYNKLCWLHWISHRRNDFYAESFWSSMDSELILPLL